MWYWITFTSIVTYKQTENKKRKLKKRDESTSETFNCFYSSIIRVAVNKLKPGARQKSVKWKLE